MSLVAVPLDTVTTSGCAIKVLDLLTNRYHVGKVRAARRDSLVIEMPITSRMRAGQRIRFVLADDASVIVARRAMRAAVIAHVEAVAGAQLMLLHFCGEPAAT